MMPFLRWEDRGPENTEVEAQGTQIVAELVQNQGLLALGAVLYPKSHASLQLQLSSQSKGRKGKWLQMPGV